MSDKDQAKAERAAKLKEITAYKKERPFGIRPDQETMYCGKTTWKIRPDGHRKSVRDKVVKIAEAYRNFLVGKDGIYAADSTEVEQADNYAAEILALGLVDFNRAAFDKAADDPSIGPGVLLHLATELKVFLVDSGGKVAARHSQMLSDITILTASDGSTD